MLEFELLVGIVAFCFDWVFNFTFVVVLGVPWDKW